MQRAGSRLTPVCALVGEMAGSAFNFVICTDTAPAQRFVIKCVHETSLLDSDLNPQDLGQRGLK